MTDHHGIAPDAKKVSCDASNLLIARSCQVKQYLTLILSAKFREKNVLTKMGMLKRIVVIVRTS